MARICVITTSRADYGLLYPLLLKLKNHHFLDLQLVAGGTHLREDHGYTEREITADGFSISSRVDMLTSPTENPLGVALAMGRGTGGFAEVYDRLKPDLVVVFGDRFEMFSAACAAVPFNIPLAHIGGGESTAGSVDDVYRYAITSMSKYHFVSLRQYKDELIKRGVEGSNITVVGYPAIENMKNEESVSENEIINTLGINPGEKFLLITVHPETCGHFDNLNNIRELLNALEDPGVTAIFTAANADNGGEAINRKLEEFCRDRENAYFYKSLGRRMYLSLLKKAAAVVGNSSSGIVETALWGIPAVNLGKRQEGRIKGKNVIDSEFEAAGIRKALLEILEGRTKKLSLDDRHIFGDGDTSSKIIASLEKIFIRN